MTYAEQLKDRWINDTTPCMDIGEWAREVDPKCHVEGYLYTSYKRIVFSDCSVAILSVGCLTVKGK